MVQYNFVDLTDTPPFGRWKVLRRAPNSPSGDTYWICQCACGTVKAVNAYTLRKGLSLSCGCYKAEVTSRVKRIHGMKNTPEYRAWQNMKKRCYNPRNVNYPNYGGRGIRVCDRWKDSFLNFLADMGMRPGTLYSLERKNNDLNYTPDNTLWATDHEQRRNKRTNHLITFNNQTHCLQDWATQTGRGAATLSRRLNTYGWSVERALTTPIRPITSGPKPSKSALHPEQGQLL